MTKNIQDKVEYWEELTEEEKKAIHNQEDIPIISIIKGIPAEEKKEIYNHINHKDASFHHYMQEQTEWVKDLIFYMNQKYNRDMSKSPELAEEIMNNLCYRFRLYFAAKYIGEIKICDKNKKAIEFVKMARKYNRLL